MKSELHMRVAAAAQHASQPDKPYKLRNILYNILHKPNGYVCRLELMSGHYGKD